MSGRTNTLKDYADLELNGQSLEVLEKFSYHGDTVWATGCAGESVLALRVGLRYILGRVAQLKKAMWSNWRKFLKVFTTLDQEIGFLL